MSATTTVESLTTVKFYEPGYGIEGYGLARNIEFRPGQKFLCQLGNEDDTNGARITEAVILAIREAFGERNYEFIWSDGVYVFRTVRDCKSSVWNVFYSTCGMRIDGHEDAVMEEFEVDEELLRNASVFMPSKLPYTVRSNLDQRAAYQIIMEKNLKLL